MCLMAVWSVDYCQAIFDQYAIMFQISKREREFICAFGEAAAKQDQTLAAEQYERYEQLGGCMPFAVMRYIYPDFLWKQTRKGFTVHTGETGIFWWKPVQRFGVKKQRLLWMEQYVFKVEEYIFKIVRYALRTVHRNIS